MALIIWTSEHFIHFYLNQCFLFVWHDFFWKKVENLSHEKNIFHDLHFFTLTSSQFTMAIQTMRSLKYTWTIPGNLKDNTWMCLSVQQTIILLEMIHHPASPCPKLQSIWEGGGLEVVVGGFGVVVGMSWAQVVPLMMWISSRAIFSSQLMGHLACRTIWF